MILGFVRIFGQKIMEKVKKDDGVSPVVGVMLMLVVTIVIAAVVTLFATGLTTSAEAAPVAVLEAVVDSSYVE